jgi:nucleoside-diphosphate-sugar epimerase
MIQEAESRGLVWLIARCADFYGPGVENVSMLTETVIKPLSEGKTANWMGRADVPHSFTYVPDAAAATAMLGNTADAYGEVWHLPTAKEPPTGKGWVELTAKSLGTKPKFKEVGKGMVRLLGIFVPIMREMVEMLYQYDRPYIFDSTKFEKRFGMSPTPYAEGIQHIVKTDYGK